MHLRENNVSGGAPSSSLRMVDQIVVSQCGRLVELGGTCQARNRIITVTPRATSGERIPQHDPQATQTLPTCDGVTCGSNEGVSRLLGGAEGVDQVGERGLGVVSNALHHVAYCEILHAPSVSNEVLLRYKHPLEQRIDRYGNCVELSR